MQEWLTIEKTLSLFHHQCSPVRRAYVRFIAAGVCAPDPTADAPRSGFISSEAFVERMLAQVDAATLSLEIARKSRPALSLDAIARGNKN